MGCSKSTMHKAVQNRSKESLTLNKYKSISTETTRAPTIQPNTIISNSTKQNKTKETSQFF